MKDIRIGFDCLATGRFGLGNQYVQQRMRAVPAEKEDARQETGFARFREDAQTFGDEQPLAPPVLLVPEAANLLDQRVGKSGDLAGQGSNPAQ